MKEVEYKIDTNYCEKESGFVSKVPAFRNIAAFGETKEESIRNVKKVLKDYIKFLKANNKPIPSPDKNK